MSKMGGAVFPLFMQQWWAKKVRRPPPPPPLKKLSLKETKRKNISFLALLINTNMYRDNDLIYHLEYPNKSS